MTVGGLAACCCCTSVSLLVPAADQSEPAVFGHSLAVMLERPVEENNSCSCLTRTRKLRKLPYKLSLVNSHQLSCNSCSR